jgi:pimeloyl-ACP methyl ester carboxylesterase
MSDRPRGIAEYRTKALVEDVAGVIRSLASGPALVVGHDWGGIIAWRLAALHSELVRRLVVINAPHPQAFREQLRKHPAQWLRSSYVLFFQIPWLPERLIPANDFAALEKLLRHQPLNPDAFTERDVQLYKAAFAGPQGLTGPINYYRAAVRYPADLYGEPTTVTTPTLVLWSEQDPFLGVEVLEELRRWAPTSEICRAPQASHWLQNEQPEWVNDRLRAAFLG